MSEKNLTKEFNEKFDELTLHNQRYIFAIQQALIYAQENEQIAKGIRDKSMLENAVG